jgi:biotin transport system substrate-specific component
MTIDRHSRIARVALSCLFAALCAAGAFIALPIPGSPVPVIVQNLFVVLAGLLLGPIGGSSAVLIFLCLGALGFPVFSGGRGGLAHFAGPTGGYMIGYLVAAFFAGAIAKKRGLLRCGIGAAIGFISILAMGVVRLKLLKNVDWGKAFAAGVLPFLPGDAVKTVLGTLVATKLGPFVDSLTKGTGPEND